MTDSEDTPEDAPGGSGGNGERVDADTGEASGSDTAVRRDRFSGGPARGFMSSLAADRRIFAADLAVDRAHVVMLAEQGVVDEAAAGAILGALDDVEAAGHAELPEAEDVHEAIETAVIERVGPEGGRMHTARSRNDEVATCIRYRLRGDLLDALEAVVGARERLLAVAGEHAETLLPGFTHLQYAQPVTVAHWVASYEGALARDTERLLAAYDRTNRSPLGAAAFAGTPFDVDRERTAELLGFDGVPASGATGGSSEPHSDGVVENSMDAVSTRDFLVESTATLATLSTTLSGLAEDLVVYSGRGYVEISDDYASTSSIMPQKKKPGHAGARPRDGGPGRRGAPGPADDAEGPPQVVQHRPAGGDAPRLDGRRRRPGGAGSRDWHARHRRVERGRPGRGSGRWLLDGDRRRRQAGDGRCPVPHGPRGGGAGGAGRRDWRER